MCSLFAPLKGAVRRWRTEGLEMKMETPLSNKIGHFSLAGEENGTRKNLYLDLSDRSKT